MRVIIRLFVFVLVQAGLLDLGVVPNLCHHGTRAHHLLPGEVLWPKLSPAFDNEVY